MINPLTINGKEKINSKKTSQTIAETIVVKIKYKKKNIRKN